MPHRPRFGDLFEIETVKGLGYIQYCHREGGGPLSSGPLVRAIEGLHHQRPADLEEIVYRPTLFWTYYPLGPASSQKLVAHLGTFPIPADALSYPMLRSRGGIDKTGLVHDWNILGRDADRQHKVLRIVKILNEEEKRLSNSSIISHPVLVDRIEEQYRPEIDPVMLRSIQHWLNVEKGEDAASEDSD